MCALRICLVALALAALLPTTAGAGEAPRPAPFSVHDLDRDGYLSREEYAALRAECTQRRGHRCRLLAFEVLDIDQNGRIAEDELLHHLGRRHRGGWHAPHPDQR